MSEERLDRIERILEAVAVQQQVNTQAIAELRQRDEAVLAEMRHNIEDLVSMVTAQTQRSEEGFSRFMEALKAYSDRNEQDHLRLSAAITTLVDALTRKFGSNGHANQ